MSERGVFAVDRGIWDHPKLAEEGREFSKIEAWLWLLGAAAWKPHTRWISGKPVQLNRGQLAASTRTMAKIWGWSEAKVRRFLLLLKTDAVGDAQGDAEIDARTDAGVTVITIRKYNEYQRVSLPTDAATDAPANAINDAISDAEVTQERRIKEDKENKESLSRAKRTRVRAGKDRFEEFWQSCPKREGSNPKEPARRIYNAAITLGATEQQLIDAAKAWRASIRPDQLGTRFVPHVRTWLSQERWKDTAEPPATFTAPIDGDLPIANWEAKVRDFARQNTWSRCWVGPGSEPGKFGCLAPPEIQRKYGFEPAQAPPPQTTNPEIGDRA